MFAQTSSITPFDIQDLLLASLQPDSRKQAELSLNTLTSQAGFAVLLLTFLVDTNKDFSARLSGSILLKNTVKERWKDVRVFFP